MSTEAAPDVAFMPLWPDTPTSADLLGFEDIAAPVILAVQRPRLDPVAIGVHGDWGCGKSTILEIVGDALDKADGVLVIRTRPWEYDPTIDSRATLIGEVLEALATHAAKDNTLSDAVKAKFSALRKRIQWTKAITLASKSAMTMTLPSLDGVIGIFGEPEAAADPTMQGFRAEFGNLMKEDLQDIRRVVVLVDDLDRCLPETVVATLEAIKLFLSVEKMAFVVAADLRLVKLAIAQRFDGSRAGTQMAKEYVEKIIQIPIEVPALGLGDTEAYLALLLLDHRSEQIDDARAETIKDVKAHCAGRRRTAEQRPLADLPEQLATANRVDLRLAELMSRLLAEPLNGNPRRLKRFLNAFWVRSDVAARRGITLDASALAKLMVLEYTDDDAFKLLVNWSTAGTVKDNLGKLEANEPVAGAPSTMKNWAVVRPHLSAMDVAPYLRLAASLTRRSSGLNELRADLAEILGDLTDVDDGRRAVAIQTMKKYPAEDQVALTKEIFEVLRAQPDVGQTASDVLVAMLVEMPLAQEHVILGAETLDPTQVDGGVAMALGEAQAPYKARARKLLTGWKDSGVISDDVARFVEAALDQLKAPPA